MKPLVVNPNPNNSSEVIIAHDHAASNSKPDPKSNFSPGLIEETSGSSPVSGIQISDANDQLGQYQNLVVNDINNTQNWHNSDGAMTMGLRGGRSEHGGGNGDGEEGERGTWRRLVMQTKRMGMLMEGMVMKGITVIDMEVKKMERKELVDMGEVVFLFLFLSLPLVLFLFLFYLYSMLE